ncbi:GDP-mannose mannosyl hydrolase [Halorubrum tebenquichense]|uniref:GDP-mannose mannosyl hydrolase n=1 Tax=Halorubrum tebenquichense DSM 14210 TaxID=1227485 RepID=M0DXE7_9EURY|nr:NUDIX domain-containing protein [Halorubrum tebenquichense]ELZ39397.1 GDP-mannose mannosyl hydrolase [Halorubrum tebenquichense DSM 14210]
MDDEWIPADDWRTIVANVPIVSVDLVIRRDDGVLLGKRTNEPAKGYWFVPGGRVLKDETRREAVHRVAETELGIEVEIVESLGAFEHVYDTSDVDGVDTKHYLANGYVVDMIDGDVEPDAQHSAFETFRSAPEPCHEYVRAYVEVASAVEGWNA